MAPTNVFEYTIMPVISPPATQIIIHHSRAEWCFVSDGLCNFQSVERVVVTHCVPNLAPPLPVDQS